MREYASRDTCVITGVEGASVGITEVEGARGRAVGKEGCKGLKGTCCGSVGGRHKICLANTTTGGI